MQLMDEERLDWLRLVRSERVGPRTFRALIDHFGNAGAALSALPDLARRGGAGRPPKICTRADAERELAKAARIGIRYLALGETEYPVQLAAIDDPPPLIGVRGNTLDRPMVAIVGSRNASAAGAKFAQIIARDLGAAGFAIVSGLARGVDAAAHRGALATGTIAVLAGGHDCIYPPEHADLASALLESGSAISEMPPDWAPKAHDFPRRNRLISGLALGVIVVEAAKRSGSLITARLALEQGREVFAVPGSPLDPRNEGTNALIKQGATPITEANDVIAVLEPLLGRPLTPSAEPSAAGPGLADRPASDTAGAHIAALLSATPVSVDDLVRLSGAAPGVVRTVLLELEVAGRLRRDTGGRVALGEPSEEACRG
jgi:DNA processing protein